MGQPQREPRDDQKRDKDSIRRYEIASDVDGDATRPHVEDNVLSFHELTDFDFKKPKFVFVFKDHEDLVLFAYKIAQVATNGKGF